MLNTALEKSHQHLDAYLAQLESGTRQQNRDLCRVDKDRMIKELERMAKQLGLEFQAGDELMLGTPEVAGCCMAAEIYTKECVAPDAHLCSVDRVEVPCFLLSAVYCLLSAVLYSVLLNLTVKILRNDPCYDYFRKP
jgi:hypothetical protein